MLDCCHCLCGKERSASKRLDQCYPLDNRPDPVNAHVRELISWGTHDIARFETIYDLLADRIRNDIAHNNVNSTSVGVKILGRLIETVPEINLNISNILVNVAIQLINTKKSKYLDIATDATNYLLAHAQKYKLKDFVTNIVKSYLKLLNKSETAERAYTSLSTIIEQAAVNTIPIQDILKAIKDQISSNTGARSVVVSIARSVILVMLPSFADQLFIFFNENKIWENTELLQQVMQIMLTEMKEKFSPSFFKLWLEQLPPRTHDSGKCDVIIKTSLYLMESVPPERLLSTTEVDALTLVFYFILKLPSLDYSNKDEIEKDAFSLCKGMAAFYATTDIVQIAHHQIWVSLPAGEEPSTDYNPKTISTIFKFNTMFDAALGNVLSKRIVKDCLKRIVSFFMYFPKHHKEIFMIVLKYLRSLAKVNPSGRTESIIPMLLALQKDTKKSNGESSMILHTFIMCAMIDAVEDTAPPVQKYVKKVVDLRLNANPPMADVDAPFFKEYFPDFKKPKKSKKDKKKDKKKGDKNKDGDNEEKQEMVYFKKKKLMNTFIDLKNRSSVFRLITDLGNTEFDDDAEEDEENIEDEPEDEGNDVQLIYQIGESDDNSAEDQSAGNENNGESEEEKEKKRKKAYKYIEKLEYKWNSSISSLPA